MSEHSAEADRIDEAVVSGDEDATTDSHAADVAAGYDDPDDAPVQPSTEEDGTL
jgi:hypothetical protein